MQVCECKDNGYLLSSKKIGSGAFSKVYLADATHERMHHNPKLSSDLQGKRHTMVRQAHLPPQGAPVPPSRPLRIQTHSGTIKLLWLPPPETLPSPISCPEASPGLLQADHPVPKPLEHRVLGTGGSREVITALQGHCSPSVPPEDSSKVYKGQGPALPQPAPQGPSLTQQAPSTLQIAIKIVSTTEAPVEFSHKPLPREISVTQRYLRAPEPVGRGLDTACPHSPPPQG
ncbi:uncharacterized protein LOC131384225 [Hylobates moloch]|uniref:uncharacterized protein LOC131384225 n=1 Tax=Hylobates moloch TaxID=81572 RepID=UPI00267559DB|nr:uncharacterized protein LOC131384225 [Hylobates moloch]